MSELTERILSEAAIADRPGSLHRLETIAADVAALERKLSANTEPAAGPKRIQMSRKHPWRADNPDAVIVSRPSKWGNPWKVGAPSAYWMGPGRSSPFRPRPVPVMDARQVTYIFRAAIDVGELPYTRDDLAELAGKDLACWCPLDQPCHADVLLELANGSAT